MADFDAIPGNEITVLTTADRIPIKRTSGAPGAKAKWIKGINIGSGGTLASGIQTVDSLTFDPGTPIENVVRRANAGAGTYIHFLSASSTPIVVASGDGQVDFIFSTTTGYWTKVVATLDLTGINSQIDNLNDLSFIRQGSTQNLGYDVTGSLTAVADSDGLCIINAGIKSASTASPKKADHIITTTNQPGQLIAVHFREIELYYWEEIARNTINVAGGREVKDISSLNITVLDTDFFGVVGVGSTVPMYKFGITGAHFIALSLNDDGKYSVNKTEFEDHTPKNTVAIDFMVVVKEDDVTVKSQLQTLVPQVEALQAGVNSLLPGMDNTTTIRVQKDGTVGTDGVAIIGNHAISDAYDSITDATPSKKYQVSIAPGIHQATVAADFTKTLHVLGEDYKSLVVGKDNVDLIGDDKRYCILTASLPNNLGPTFPYHLYQTIYWNCNNATIENLTVIAQYMRYAIHIDGGSASFLAKYVQNFKNAIFKHLGNSGDVLSDASNPPAYGIGLGTSSKMRLKFQFCETESPIAPLYYHSNFLFDGQAELVFDHHRFENTGTNKMLGVLRPVSPHRIDSIILKNCSFGNCYIIEVAINTLGSTEINQQRFDQSDTRFPGGSGNEPIIFHPPTNGGTCLRFETIDKTAGNSIRFDTSSSAYPLIMQDKDLKTGTFVNEYGETVTNGYYYKDGDTGISAIAGGRMIITDAPNANSKWLFSLGKKLGNCSTVNKTLSGTIKVNNIVTNFNIVFNKNYIGSTTDTQQAAYPNEGETNSVLLDIRAAIGSLVTVTDDYQECMRYYPEFTDTVKWVRSSEPILKGMGVVLVNGIARKALSTDKTISGIALDNIATGTPGRLLTKGYLDGLPYGQYFYMLQDAYSAVMANEDFGIGTTAGKFSRTATNKTVKAFANDYVGFNL